MLKEITPVYQNIIAQAMTGTAVVTSAITDVKYKDSIAIQLQWTGTPNGTFAVQGSLDYFPSNVTGGGTPNAGTWTTINALDQNGNPPVASGAAGQILMNLNQLSFPWIRVIYTNTSSTGTLNGYISGKSLG